MAAQHDEDDSSFLSDVLDFVSRELNQFVASATGGSVETTPARCRSRCPHVKCAKLKRNSSAREASSPQQMFPHRASIVVEDVVPIFAARRVPPITMPGALIPRSPTSEPDDGVFPPSSADDLIQSSETQTKSDTISSVLGGAANTEIDDQPRSTADESPPANNSTTNSTVSEALDTSKHSTTSPRFEKRSPRNPVRGNKPDQSRRLSQLDEERLQDKETIRRLEEEVKRLKEELTQKNADIPSTIRPPSPPPLPPMRVNNGVDQVTVHTPNPSLLFASARAALKRAPTPVEAPINPPPFRKRQGLPTVGVPPDKMAEFLNELKSVRLRKISTSDQSANSSISSEPYSLISPSNIYKPNPSLSSKSVLQHSAVVSKAGNKRKRDPCDSNDLRPRSSVHGTIHADIQSVAGERNPMGTYYHNTYRAGTLSRSAITNASSTSWLSHSTASTTTPSLTSDNDHDKSDINPDDLPATPPHSEHARDPAELLVSFDVDDFIGQRDSLPASERPLGTTNLFSKRTPLSPLPSDPPRKPYPPSRLRRSPRLICRNGIIDRPHAYLAQPMGREQKSFDMLRQPLSQANDRYREQEGNKLSSMPKLDHLTQRTLDEELRRAVSSLESIEDSEADAGSENESCDIFLGAGTRDKSTNLFLRGPGGVPQG